LGLPNNVGNEEAIWALISAESKSVVSQDIDRLMRLWSEDARITDAKHTPDDPSDDQTVQGQDAIRYRYTHSFFQALPALRRQRTWTFTSSVTRPRSLPRRTLAT
jgi:hypothetical protein